MRGSKLYVGNLSQYVNEADLKKLFIPYGQVEDVKIVQEKGFAFVEMSSEAEAEEALTALNNQIVKNKAIHVNEAWPEKERQSRGYRSS
ncbi:MAG: RNA-binding protein [Spirochaetales bacterium]|nr:RNA-binding protein [Spirochaetales bacterium]